MDEEQRKQAFQQLRDSWQREEWARHEAYHRAWRPGMPEYCYSELNDRLVEAVPELRERYEGLRRDWGEDLGQYVVYRDLLRPYVIVQLELGGPPDALIRTFAFVEELASHPDEHVQNLAQLEICETIFEARLLGQAWSLMGERTRKLCLNDLMWQTGVTLKDDEYSTQDVADYNAAWQSELDSLGGLAKVSLPGVFEIHKRLVAQYRLHHHFYDSYENWDLYTVVDKAEYRRRFKLEFERLGNRDDLYEWLGGLGDIRDRLFDALRPRRHRLFDALRPRRHRLFDALRTRRHRR